MFLPPAPRHLLVLPLCLCMIFLLYRITLPSISLHSQCPQFMLTIATACRSPETFIPWSYALVYNSAKENATYFDCPCIALDLVSSKLELWYFCNDFPGPRIQWTLRRWNPFLTIEVNFFLLLKEGQVIIPKCIIILAIHHAESSKLRLFCIYPTFKDPACSVR